MLQGREGAQGRVQKRGEGTRLRVRMRECVREGQVASERQVVSEGEGERA